MLTRLSVRGAGALRVMTAAILLVTAQAVAWQSLTRSEPLRGTLALAALVFLPVGLVFTTLLGLQWRWARSAPAGWLAVVLGAVVVHGVLTSLARAFSPPRAAGPLAWEAAADLLVGLGLLALVVGATAARPPPREQLLGLCAAPPLLAAVLTWQTGPHDLLPALVVVGAGLTTAAFVWRRVTPGWVGHRVAGALLALATARAICTTPVDGPAPLAVALALELAGVLLLCDTALLSMMADLRQEALLLEGLHDRLELSVSAHRSDQERLHEIASTAAGIASATHLVQGGEPIPPEARRRLEDMLDAETARLLRLLDRSSQTRTALPDPPPDHRPDRQPDRQPERQPDRQGAVDLDQVICRLVVAQEAQGRHVAWRPSGLRVAGRPDEIVEVLHILLDNAAVHAPEGGTRIEVVRRGAAVHVAVADRGPGIPEAAALRIFEWGGHRTGSPGQGIGLAVARRLSSANGGRLDHVPTADGTRFEVALQHHATTS